MQKKSHKIIYLSTMEECNEILDEVKKCCVHIYFRPKKSTETFKWDAFIEVNPSSIYISYKKGSKNAIEYRFYLTGDNSIKEWATGGEAFGILSRYYKIQRLDNPEIYGSASQFLYKNKKYDGRRVKAYCYDMNSAFAWMMLKPIPDIDTLEFDACLQKGQIGFYQGVEGLQIGFEVGRYYEMVCQLMPSPFESFVKTWYAKKKNAKKVEDKMRAKNVLNMAVGAMQNYNPLLRACIVGRCNLYFKNLIDKNTIYANTDSIVSTVRRYDLEENIGDEIGQFKFERNGDLFAWQNKAINYQRNFEPPKMRGVPKKWFDKFEKKNKRKFDILIDSCPDTTFNDYTFNKETLKIEEL